VGPDEVISAVYSGQSNPWRVDAENVLFYNVGVGAFAESAVNGLRFERVFSDASAIGGDSRFPHAAAYEPSSPGAAFRHSTRGETLAILKQVVIPASTGAPSATEIWASIREAARDPDLVALGQPGVCGGHFGLALSLSVPVARSSLRAALHGAALVKPIVDGVASAFTAHDGGDLEGVSERIGERLGKKPADVAKELMWSPSVLLSTQRLVVCRSRGVQWLPPDDRCVACELLIVRDAEGPDWRLSGALFVALPSSRADAEGRASVSSRAKI
jgi:hypothetical protein